MRIIYQGSPLAVGPGPSRFSSLPATTPSPPFRVLYAATDLATAAHETLIRDQFDLSPSRVLWPDDYRDWIAVEIFSTPASRSVSWT